MSDQGRKLLLLCLLGALALWLWHDRTPGTPPAQPHKVKKSDDDKKKTPLRPWRSPKGDALEASGKPQLGGRKSPDGTAELTVDLPAELCKHNIASKGLGCCVFRSINYAGLWQHVPEVVDLPEKMKQAGIAGGGWPEKVDSVLKRFAPTIQYLQDSTGDEDLLEAIIKSGRMACVTYNGFDPNYGQQSIAHMVCLPYFDRQTGWACILDNNFPDPQRRVWLSPSEFVKRWRGGGGSGWVVALLHPAPPPPPHN